MDALRPFELRQTTPPVGPTNTVSQAFFSRDESRLFATVKGDLAVAGRTGFFSVFAVDEGEGGAVVSRRDDEVFVADASFGAAVLSLRSDKAVMGGRARLVARWRRTGRRCRRRR